VRRTVIALLLAMLLLLSGLQGCDNVANSGPAWLVGQWHVSYNPLNDDADVLEFMPENKAAILTVDGRNITGHYLLRDNTLVLVIEKGSRSIETEFHISDTRDRLTYKNGAYYTRADTSNAVSTAKIVNQ